MRFMTLTPHIIKHLLKDVLFLTFCISPTIAVSQISHGGKPFALHPDARIRTATVTSDLFVDMPSFDAQEALVRSEQNKATFKSLEFAHKFFVHLRPDNSGIRFTNDGMQVWRVGLRSKGAYSLNILFSKFHLPEGANVFVYNSDQTEILGSYTHQNNTELKLLPVQPIGGDELIVEYQEPVDAPFPGEIEIGEVNHDFRGLFRANEPMDPTQSCHPNIVCYPENLEPGSGVVALIINGITYCTGVLVNNTSEDGTPYLLTATHCLNNDYHAAFLANRKYDVVAGSIVAFFNYDSPMCSNDIRGPVQMTMASADSVLISERYDISLLKLKQTPPKTYQPFYLGWNVGTSPGAPFHGLHHPNGGVKKVAIEEQSLVIGSFGDSQYNMEPNAHWAVRAWDTGTTEGGSSGSPLLDNNKRVVGTLTGGESMCSSPRGPDLYASLNKAWQVTGSLGNPNSLQNYLDPEDSQLQQTDGYNPYANEPISKSHNFDVSDTFTQSYHNSVPMFTTGNTFGYTEFAEEFNATTETQLDGVFISSPATDTMSDKDIRIRIYTGEKGPETQIYEQPYRYTYTYYSNDDFYTTPRDMRHNLENYIGFTDPVTVSGKLYISYLDVNNASSGFSALNIEPRKVGSGRSSTAWMKNATGWVRSSENMENPLNTSLLVIPYVIGGASLTVDTPGEDFHLKVYHTREAERIFVESTRELVQWEIFYVSGQKIYQEATDNSINRISYPSAHLARGVYIVKVKTAEGEVKAAKVLVR